MPCMLLSLIYSCMEPGVRVKAYMVLTPQSRRVMLFSSKPQSTAIQWLQSSNLACHDVARYHSTGDFREVVGLVLRAMNRIEERLSQFPFEVWGSVVGECGSAGSRAGKRKLSCTALTSKATNFTRVRNRNTTLFEKTLKSLTVHMV